MTVAVEDSGQALFKKPAFARLGGRLISFLLLPATRVSI